MVRIKKRARMFTLENSLLFGYEVGGSSSDVLYWSSKSIYTKSLLVHKGKHKR